MNQEERIKLAELIRNNPELPVRALVEYDHGEFPLIGDVLSCGIREYGKTKTGRHILRCPEAEERLPDIEWKPAIFIDVCLDKEDE